MGKVFEFLIVFYIGGLAYGAVELLWRGRTHWTMLLAGGVCFLFMYLTATATALAPLGQYTLCAALISAVEFVTGAVVNLRLGWNVWDYSDQPANLYGQICLRYTAYWFMLSVPGCALARFLYGSVFHRGL